jgi:hypothetical protein
VSIFIPLDTSAKAYTEDSLHDDINSSVAPDTSESTLFDLARENGMSVPASTQNQDAGLFLPLDDPNYPVHDFNHFALNTRADTTGTNLNWGEVDFTASIAAFEKSLVPMNTTHSNLYTVEHILFRFT